MRVCRRDPPRAGATRGRAARGRRRCAGLADDAALDADVVPAYLHCMSGVIDERGLARALEMVRAGDGVSLGSVGGKYDKGLVCRSGQFWIEEFDEGQSFDREITEEQARQELAKKPEVVRMLLARPLWRAFFRALIEGERGQAKAALDATGGQPHRGEQFRFVYEAFLAWPEQRPSPALREQLKSFVEEGMALHPLRAGDYAPEDTAANAKSVEYLTALGEMTGWPRALYEHRAEFYERLGNLQAALDDCLLEKKLNGAPLGDRIQALRAALRANNRT